MNVLFASSNHYFPQLIGGGETSTHDGCLQFQRMGISPCVLSALAPRGLLTLKLRIRKKLFRQVHPVDNSLGYPVYRVWEPGKDIEAISKKTNADVIVIIKNNKNLIRSALATGLPCYLYLHSVDFVDLSDCDGLRYIANSAFTARRLYEKFGFIAPVIPPWVYPERYRVDSSRKNVLFVNPQPGKGIDTTLALIKLFPKIPFVILESWPLTDVSRKRYRDQISECTNVIWRRSTLDMRDVYRDTKILLVPSSHDEAWGRVVSEVQVSGIPAITSNRGGLPEAVGKGGMVIDLDQPNHLNAWANALEALWSDTKLYEQYSVLAKCHAEREEFIPTWIAGQFAAILMAKT